MMDPEFWKARWSEGKIGFHEGTPNAFLEKHVAELGSPRRILVPFCGKTEDLAFLASRGHEVVGIEVVEAAVRAFFTEHQLTPEVTPGPKVTAFAANGITILLGDLFDCTKEQVGEVTGLYDRAALVALPRDVRRRYVEKIRGLLAPNAHGVVITFEYPQDRMDGPPFSVPEGELRALFAGTDLRLLGEAPTAKRGRFQDAGVDAMERCFAF